jgi:hypothetical protein
MPTGTGAINLRNLPVTKYAINPGLFNQLTSRVIFDPINFPLPTFGNYTQNQLLQVGVVGSINLVVEGTIDFTADAGDVQPTARWPWDMIAVQLSGNGQNNFINCQGIDLRLRALASNRAFLDGVSFWPALADFAGAAASYPFKLVYKVPVAMDDTTLVGALYAQSEATNLTYKITTGTLADLLDVNTSTGASVTATVFMEEEIFEVPYDPNHPDTLVIPDLTVLHGFVSNDNAVASQTTLDTQLFRINGQLERLFYYTMDKSTAANPVLVPTSNYTQTQLIYGSNQTPYTFNPQDFLDIRNNRDYRVPLASVLNGLNSGLMDAPISAVPVPDGVYCLDFIADNAVRDQVLLEGVTNLRLRTEYASAPTGGSYVHFVQETLFA